MLIVGDMCGLLLLSGASTYRRALRVGVEQINTALIIATAHKKRHISTQPHTHSRIFALSMSREVDGALQIWTLPVRPIWGARKNASAPHYMNVCDYFRNKHG